MLGSCSSNTSSVWPISLIISFKQDLEGKEMCFSSLFASSPAMFKTSILTLRMLLSHELPLQSNNTHTKRFCDISFLFFNLFLFQKLATFRVVVLNLLALTASGATWKSQHSFRNFSFPVWDFIAHFNSSLMFHLKAFM